jgi:O-methyltransferase
MAGLKRCLNLWSLCRQVLKRNIPGDFVECGVWRGGSALIMGSALKSSKQNRLLHLFDSFEGLPQPGLEDGTRAAEYSDEKNGGELVPIAKCEASLDHVRMTLFHQAGLDPAHIRFHVGWFQNTVPEVAESMGPLAVLRLDGDWYASTRVCLENLYPRLSSGGILILDDYFCWEGCRKATDEYRQKHCITASLVKVDEVCCYWLKP